MHSSFTHSSAAWDTANVITQRFQASFLLSEKSSLKYQPNLSRLMSFWISVWPAAKKMVMILLLLTRPERNVVR